MDMQTAASLASRPSSSPTTEVGRSLIHSQFFLSLLAALFFSCIPVFCVSASQGFVETGSETLYYKGWACSQVLHALMLLQVVTLHTQDHESVPIAVSRRNENCEYAHDRNMLISALQAAWHRTTM